MSEKPRDTRYRVHLQVRFQVARDFVLEYAENLSKGGLFVRGAEGVEPLQPVTIELDLPGAGSFTVTGRVAHVLDAENASFVGRKAGAGFEIVDSPPGFKDALGAYLLRLGRRRDVMTLSTSAEARGLLEAAGYQVGVAGSAEDILEQFASSDRQVVAVVVDRAHEEAYREALSAAGAGGLVHGIDYLEELEALLPTIDDEMAES